MKKVLSVIVIFFVVSMMFSGDLRADSTKLFANFGILTDDSFSFADYLWTIGANIDFSINDLFMISPELNLLTSKFKFNIFLLEPSILANVKLGKMFLGGGLTTLVIVAGNFAAFDTDFGLKLNVGYRSSNLRFRLYMITSFEHMFSENVIGAQIGLGF